MADSAIEWTDLVWNPTTGCDKVSPGCDNCYALTMARRLKAMGQPKYQADGDPTTSGPGFALTVHADTLTMPLQRKTGRRIFVNSMSDLFHDQVPADHLARVLAVIALTPQHTYQLLTKRHARMRTFLTDECRCGRGHAPAVHLRSKMSWAVSKANPDRIPGVPDDAEHRVYFETPWPLPNLWVGVSAEDQKWADIRIPSLLQTPAAVRWVSAEPLLGALNLTRSLIPEGAAGSCYDINDDWWHTPGTCHACRPALDWVVAGGESGPGARPVASDWIRDLRDQCAASGTPFLFKQWGGRTPKANGRVLDDRTHDAYPELAGGAPCPA